MPLHPPTVPLPWSPSWQMAPPAPGLFWAHTVGGGGSLTLLFPSHTLTALTSRQLCLQNISQVRPVLAVSPSKAQVGSITTPHPCSPRGPCPALTHPFTLTQTSCRGWRHAGGQNSHKTPPPGGGSGRVVPSALPCSISRNVGFMTPP